MGSRRGFIIRMKIGNLTPGAMDSVSALSHCMRVRQRNTLGPSADGQHYAVVHVTGYIKNWPPAGPCISLHHFTFWLSLLSFFVGGTCPFHVTMLRPASRAGPMLSFKGRASVWCCALPSAWPDSVCEVQRCTTCVLVMDSACLLPGQST